MTEVSINITSSQLVFLTILSFGVGILGGFVGLALGTMRLPVLLLMGIPLPIAAGTNIAVSALASLTGSIRHFREGRINFQVVATMGIPAVLGAFIGGFAGGLVSETIIVGLAGIFVMWQGIELIFASRRQEGSPASTQLSTSVRKPTFPSMQRYWIESVIGLGIGLLGGAVGLILGSIRLPTLVNFLKMNPRIAAGTNMVIGLFMGLAGFIGHGIQNHMHIPLLIGMGIAAMVGSALGARLTGKVSRKTLVLSMGCVLLPVGILLMVDAILLR
jgi:uncharacterized membrane protein YfcA